RRLFFELLGREMARAKRNPAYGFAVLYIDLNGFKQVNDELGHEMGDALLVSVADRLKGSLRPMDAAARVGGDEFTVLIADLSGASEAEAVAARLSMALSQPHRIGGRDIQSAASIGVAHYHAGYDHPHEIVRDADAAMYRVKHPSLAP